MALLETAVMLMAMITLSIASVALAIVAFGAYRDIKR